MPRCTNLAVAQPVGMIPLRPELGKREAHACVQKQMQGLPPRLLSPQQMSPTPDLVAMHGTVSIDSDVKSAGSNPPCSQAGPTQPSSH